MKEKNGTVEFNIDSDILIKAENILEEEGISRDEFIEIIYTDVIINKGINIPFILKDHI